MRCVDCGREVDRTVGGLCSTCYLRHVVPVRFPAKVRMMVCKSCGRIKIKRSWRKEKGHKALCRAVFEALELAEGVAIEDSGCQLMNEMEHEYVFEVWVRYSVEGVFSDESRGVVRVLKGYDMCPSCTRKVSNYYAAILQVRGEGKVDNGTVEEITALLEPFIKSEDTKSFVTDMESTRGGIDFKVSDLRTARRMAKTIIDTFGGTYKESFSLYGHRDGKEVWRATVLVRIPSYRKGDIVVDKGKVYVISGIKGSTLSFIAVSDGYRTTHGKTDMIRNSVCYTKKELVSEGLILSTTPTEIMVMEQESYACIDIIRPPGCKGESGDSVEIFTVDGETYIYPNYLL